MLEYYDSINFFLFDSRWHQENLLTDSIVGLLSVVKIWKNNSYKFPLHERMNSTFYQIRRQIVMTQMDKNGSVFYRANLTKISPVISRVKNIWNGNNIKIKQIPKIDILCSWYSS